jgi:hypothetical protein
MVYNFSLIPAFKVYIIYIYTKLKLKYEFNFTI